MPKVSKTCRQEQTAEWANFWLGVLWQYPEHVLSVDCHSLLLGLLCLTVGFQIKKLLPVGIVLIHTSPTIILATATVVTT